MKNKFAIWLIPQRRRDALREIVLIIGTTAGGLTAFMGENQVINKDVVVTALLTIFFQGGMYITAQLANEKARNKQQHCAGALCLTWILLAFCSVYACNLSIFDVLGVLLMDILPIFLRYLRQSK